MNKRPQSGTLKFALNVRKWVAAATVDEEGRSQPAA